MKRFFILTAILAVFGLSSCEKEPSKAIVGTWEAVKMETSIAGIDMTVNMADAGMKLEFTFNEDGSESIRTLNSRIQCDPAVLFNLLHSYLYDVLFSALPCNLLPFQSQSVRSVSMKQEV
jgi:hypothetical protein